MSAARSTVRARLGVLAATVGVVAGLVTATPAQAAPAPADTTVGVTGPNSRVYAKGPGQSTWRDLGGAIVGAPAVASDGVLTHYVGLGTNNRLYHRTDVTGWHALTAAAALCTNPTAAYDAVADRVQVACRGGNAALYTFSFAAGDTRPVVQTLTKLGGVVQGSTALVVADEGPIFIARGGEYETEPEYYANTWVRGVSTPWERWNVYCDGSPSAVSTDAAFFFVCQFDADVLVTQTDDFTAPAPTFYEVPGRSVGTVGLAATGDGSTAHVFVQGSDGNLYDRPLTLDGTATAGWTKTTGVLRGGVGAGTTTGL